MRETIIYLDEFFLINFIADVLCLFCASRICGVFAPKWRMLFATGLGAAYSCITVIFSKIFWLFSFPVLFGMTLLCFGKREKHTLSLRFYEGKTQNQVAEEIGISQAQVSRLEKGAIARMKKSL